MRFGRPGGVAVVAVGALVAPGGFVAAGAAGEHARPGGGTARGEHGEHSDDSSGVYDISNKERLGKTEVQLVQTMIDGVRTLIEKEQELEAK